MSIPRLLKTSSFRLTLLYACLFGLSVLILFAVIYLATAGYMSNQLDAAVAADLAELRSEAGSGKGGGGDARIAAVVSAWAARAPRGVYYLLETADGRALAGNLAALPPTVGVFAMPDGTVRDASGEGHPLRGRGVRLADGAILIAARDSFQLEEVQELIARAFLWGLLITVVLAVGGGMVMSAGLLRRVETVSRTSREIMNGNLAQRIPLRGSNDEFDHLALSLNAMLERIQVLMDGLRRVSSDIAHDLRTPLTRLRQRLELARAKAGTADELHAAIDGSLHQVDAILETFGALLRIAQIESGARKAGFTRLDLSEILAAMVEIYQPVAEERRQTLTAAIEPGLDVRGDRELLTQMLANLVENAIRHAPEGAAIAIAGRQRDGAVEAVVADDGPGIPEALRGKVLQRFFRLEASRTTPGSGLGLSLVAAVAALHDIALELGDNCPGLRVLLRFPNPPSLSALPW